MSSDSHSPGSNGRLIVVSGPSGAGKSTVLKMLMEECPLPLVMSVSATTRSPRPGEQDGVNYWFLTDEEFRKRRENDDFLECFEVFDRGHWYGTLRKTVTTGLNAGKWVILEIDVQGAQSVVAEFPQAITVFIHPGSQEELERRLRGRKTETEDAIASRLETARREFAQSHLYQYLVVNDQLSKCATEVCQLLLRLAGTN